MRSFGARPDFPRGEIVPARRLSPGASGSSPGANGAAVRPDRQTGIYLPPRGLLSSGASGSSGGAAARPLSRPQIPQRPNSFQSPPFTRPVLPQRLPNQGHDDYVGRPMQNPFGPNAKVVFQRPGRVIQLHNYGVTIFRGYSPTCGPGYGYVSPFAVYNCPPYIGANYVLINTPYLYRSGVELGTYRSWSADAGYGYAAAATSAYPDRTLRAALNDLTRFWEENDVRALRRRVSPGLAVAVFGGERHLYSLRQADFLSLAADALDRVRTVSLRFESVRDRSDGLVNVYAVHVYRLRDEDISVTPRVATLRYTLAHVDGDWYVSAVSLAPEIS